MEHAAQSGLLPHVLPSVAGLSAKLLQDISPFSPSGAVLIWLLTGIS